MWPASLGRADVLLGESQAQQQRIDAPFFGEQRADFLRAVAVEQEIGIGAEQIDIADAERQRLLKMPLGGRKIAETVCGLGQHSQRPEAYFAALSRGGLGENLPQIIIAGCRSPAQTQHAVDADRRHQSLSEPSQERQLPRAFG